MSDFRASQNKAHPNKTNTLMTAIIVMLILFVSIQIWFLFGALNNALEDNVFFAVTTFVGSSLFGIASFWLLRYLPDPLRDDSVKKKSWQKGMIHNDPRKDKSAGSQKPTGKVE